MGLRAARSMNEIRHRVGIRAPIADIYEALYRPAKVIEWWSTGARGPGEVGSLIELIFPGYPNHVWKIEELTPGKLVRLKFQSGPDPWRKSELLFDLRPGPREVFVTLTHLTAPDISPDDFQYFCTKWPTFLVSLKEYLETGKGRPYPNDIKIQQE